LLIAPLYILPNFILGLFFILINKSSINTIIKIIVDSAFTVSGIDLFVIVLMVIERVGNPGPVVK